MKKKISNREILEKSALLRQVSNKQLPVKVSYAISKNTGKFESLLKLYEKEREKLVDRYAEKDEKGNLKLASDRATIKFKDELSEAGWKEGIEALLDIENDVDIRTFKLDELSNVQFSAAELGAIDLMIEEK
ncbi:MAG: hypothetical protein ABF449_00535 [Ethanoligenens sp.]